MDVLTNYVNYATKLGDQNITFLLAGVVVVLTTVLYYWPVWDSHKYPPAISIPLPFVGHIPIAIKNSKNLARHLHENRDKYGEIFTMRLDGPVVWLNSPEAIQEGFIKNADSLSIRPLHIPSPLSYLGSGRGLVDGKEGDWQKLRRLTLTVFKEHGVGKQGMEDVIQTEIKYFLEVLSALQEKPIDINHQLTQSVSNVITNIVFGRRFDYNNTQLENLQFTEFFGAFRKTAPAPFLRHLPGDFFGFQAAQRKVVSTVKFAKSEIKSHEEDIDYDNPRDYIDAFLAQRRTSPGFQCFDDENLLGVVMQLYVAGTDTTSSTLYWAFLYMALQPEVQERVYEEIKSSIGERFPASSDRDEMHFTMSTIAELLRIDIAGNSLPHCAMKDVEVLGHRIPKDTVVLGNLWSTTHNEKIYTDPGQFKADRFLNSDGEYVKPDTKYFMPFGTGRRACPGEQLARSELFLFLVSTLQRFKVVSGQEEPLSVDGTSGFVLMPPKYKLKFIARI